MKYTDVKNYIDGKFTKSENERLNVFSPLNDKIISSVPLSGMKDLNDAVNAANKA